LWGLGGKIYYRNGYLQFEGEYLNGKKWNGKIYNILNNLENELNKGRGWIKEYYDVGELKFDGEYINSKELEKEKNIKKW